MNQTELRFPLLGENIGGVLFHDMGNVYSSPSSISFRTDQHGMSDFDYMNHAVGFGIRYRTPIGPVRLDLAYSINPPRFIGFSGSFSDLLSAGRVSLHRRQPVRSTAVWRRASATFNSSFP